MATEHGKQDQFGTTTIDDSLLLLSTDGNSFCAEDKDYLESNFRVIAVGIERLRQFLFERVCNKVLSLPKCNVEHVEQVFSIYRKCMSI